VTITVRIHPSAMRQASAAVRWWVRNRPRAPDLLRTELARALAAIEHAPRSGPPCTELGPEFAAVRRMLMPRTRYYVFYVYDEEAARVDVVAVWSNLRGTPPPLPR
jgi:plasmid stabilization system protein ParE